MPTLIARNSPSRSLVLRQARQRAIKDLIDLGFQFDFLKPCLPSFDCMGKGWRKSKTSFRKITRSVNEMYIFSLGNQESVRVIKLSTGDLYFLRTRNQNK